MTAQAKQLGASEIAKFRIIHALKVVIGLSKKVVMKAQRTLKNGALQFTYLVNSVRCSCFVKKAALEKQVRIAETISDGGSAGLFESSVLENVVVPTLHKHGFGQSKLVEIGWCKSIVALFPSRYYAKVKGYFVAIVNDSYVVYTGLSVKNLNFLASATTMQELLNVLKFNVDVI